MTFASVASLNAKAVAKHTNVRFFSFETVCHFIDILSRQNQRFERKDVAIDDADNNIAGKVSAGDQLTERWRHVPKNYVVHIPQALHFLPEKRFRICIGDKSIDASA